MKYFWLAGSCTSNPQTEGVWPQDSVRILAIVGQVRGMKWTPTSDSNETPRMRESFPSISGVLIKIVSETYLSKGKDFHSDLVWNTPPAWQMCTKNLIFKCCMEILRDLLRLMLIIRIGEWKTCCFWRGYICSKFLQSSNINLSRLQNNVLLFKI